MTFQDRLFAVMDHFRKEHGRRPRKQKWRRGPVQNGNLAYKAAQVGPTFEDYLYSEEQRKIPKEAINPALDLTDVFAWEYLSSLADFETREKRLEDDDLFIHDWTGDAIVRLCVVLNYGDKTASEIEQRTLRRDIVTSAEALEDKELRGKARKKEYDLKKRHERVERLVSALALDGFELGFPYPRWTWSYLKRNGEDTIEAFWLRTFPGTVKE